MKKRSVTMYNLIVPTFIILWPPVWFFLAAMDGLLGGALLLVMLLGNLAVDWLVTALAMRWQKVPQVKKQSLAVLVPVWLSGFAADFLGSLLLFIVMVIENDWIQENISNYFYNNIFEGPYALAVTLAVVAFVGLLIYRFNMNWSLRLASLSRSLQRRKSISRAARTKS